MWVNKILSSKSISFIEIPEVANYFNLVFEQSKNKFILGF